MTAPETTFRLAAPEFFVLWQAVNGEEHPVPLGTPHVGATRAERAELIATCSRTLSARGLGTVERPDAELEALVRGLRQHERCLDLVFSHRGETARAVAAAGWGGVFAARVGAEVHLRSFRSTALASATVETLPVSPAGSGRAANVRWDDFVAAGAAGERDGAQGFLEVLRAAGVREPEANTLLRAVTTRRGGGQVGLTERNRDGHLRPTGRTVSWIDTGEGRYLAQRSGGWLVLAPTDRARLTAAVEDLVVGAGRR
ncbi:ESX secretion-associated protein EspG [Umezawaea beigongshangensis]|uniref:ESX secretion-associated protein EspG n=1 Tax=Umezawaea beigongshangensis TaxID=2780383 RepID=UPI0018F16906|nr:ESX secretion-associated protein EspG [Umezawaea beigongshangensis]